MPLARPRWVVVAFLGLVTVTLGACSGADDRGRGPASGAGSTASDPVEPAAPTASRALAAPSSAATTSAGTAIRVHVGETVLEGRLWDTATSRALIDQLPLSLTFSDLNGVEKTGHLPQDLPMDGMPDGDDPVPTDIGYYAPGGDLVFYYGDVGYWDGIARIGTIDSDLAALAEVSGDVEVTIELAD